MRTEWEDDKDRTNFDVDEEPFGTHAKTIALTSGLGLCCTGLHRGNRLNVARNPWMFPSFLLDGIGRTVAYISAVLKTLLNAVGVELAISSW